MNTAGLLVDTNLLVLFAVGTVNPNRIETFKRTNRYTKEDYELLLRLFDEFRSIYTVAHVLAEVSNLTDLPGHERTRIRLVLKKEISLWTEVEMPSVRAAQDPLYQDLGLVDAAISAVARTMKCTVLTDDLDLFLRLSSAKVPTLNFTHLRAQHWGF
jgi:rRNA-processing protein FCF1